ncbi:MAG: tail fiber domain-containing protein [Bacteroidia bacterium]
MKNLLNSVNLFLFTFLSLSSMAQVRLNIQSKFHIGYDNYTPILIGKNLVGNQNNGRWSIEYWENAVSSGVGGLNFWIPWPAAGAQNNVLFLRDVNGNVGIGKNNPSYKLDVNGSINCSQIFLLSDETLKQDIGNIQSPEKIIMNLNAYKYKKRNFVPNKIDTNERDEIKLKTAINQNLLTENIKYIDEYGYLAQDIKKILPEIVNQDENGIYSVSYLQLIPIAIEVIKNQQRRINDLEVALNKLSENLTLANQKQEVYGAKSNLIEGYVLFQNEPNPFSDKTEIRGNISKPYSRAYIAVMNLQGTLIKSFQIEKLGDFSVTFNSNELNSGLYYYSLIVDNNVIDTKKMFIHK